jgi:hypothetical protein
MTRHMQGVHKIAGWYMAMHPDRRTRKELIEAVERRKRDEIIHNAYRQDQEELKYRLIQIEHEQAKQKQLVQDLESEKQKLMQALEDKTVPQQPVYYINLPVIDVDEDFNLLPTNNIEAQPTFEADQTVQTNAGQAVEIVEAVENYAGEQSIESEVAAIHGEVIPTAPKPTYDPTATSNLITDAMYAADVSLFDSDIPVAEALALDPADAQALGI